MAALTTFHPDFQHREQPVIVTLRDRVGTVEVVGIERPRNDRLQVDLQVDGDG